MEAALETTICQSLFTLMRRFLQKFVKDCVDGGFTSVMIDASHHDFDENVRITKQVVEYAHAHGVVVETGNWVVWLVLKMM